MDQILVVYDVTEYVSDVYDAEGDVANLDCSDIEPASLRFLLARKSECVYKSNYLKALELYKPIYDKRLSELGADHMETMKTNYRIAKIFYILEKFEEARSRFEDVYERMKGHFGFENGDALLARGYIANILRRQGKEALPIYKEIYKIQSKNWPDKPFTLATRNNIALELCDQGKYDEALKVLYEFVNESGKYSNSSTLKYMIYILCKQGKFGQALFIIKSKYEERKLILGEDHPDTMEILSDIGVILADKHEYHKAVFTFKEVMRKLLKNNHNFLFLQTIWFVALILMKKSKFDKSLILFNDVYAMSKNSPHEQTTLLTLKLRAKIVDHQGNYAEALRLYKEVQAMDKPDSPDSLITSINIKRIIDQQLENSKTGPSPYDLYEIEAKTFLEICQDSVGKFVADYK